MYEEHFGLTSRPFAVPADSAAVFIGPQQASLMKSLNKALQPADSIVVLTGRAGVGKTTIAGRALESVSPARLVAKIGRIGLKPDAILELLLAGLGVNSRKLPPIQRIAAFRRLMAERNKAGFRLTIVVEDAQRLGVDSLAEVEALTAADFGDNLGANLILMGRPELRDWLKKSDILERVRQRTRLWLEVKPFGVPEVQGYLRNCVRTGGGDYDRLFAAGVAATLHRCSAGIPRVINNLCDEALTLSAETSAGPITAELISKLAHKILDVDIAAGPGANDAVAEPKPVAAEAPEAEAATDEPAADEQQEPAAVAEPAPDAEEAPAAIAATGELATDDEAAEWAADSCPTQTELPVLKPHFDQDDTHVPVRTIAAAAALQQEQSATESTVAEVEAGVLAALAAELLPPAAGSLPAAAAVTQVIEPAEVEATDTEFVATEVIPPINAGADPEANPGAGTPVAARPAAPPIDATMTAKRPAWMLQGLAQPLALVDDDAPAVASAGKDDADEEIPAVLTAEPDPTARLQVIDVGAAANAARAAADARREPAPKPLAASEIPELTLDNSLENARSVAVAEKAAKQPANRIDPKIAEELSKAKSLDDLDDEMAATLFGDQDFDAIAAAAVADVPVNNDASAAAASAPPSAAAPKAAAETAPAAAAKSPAPKAAVPKARPASPAAASPPAKSAPPKPPVTEKAMGNTGAFQMSVSSRLRMVDELTKDKPKPVYSAIRREPKDPAKPAAKPAAKAADRAADYDTGEAAVAAATQAANDSGKEGKKKGKGLSGLLNRFKL